MGILRTAQVVALVVLIAGCEVDERAEMEPTPADTVAAAEVAYAPAAFDTVVWSSDSAAYERGANVFAWACADCHGPEGRGDGGRVVAGDTLRPPSFLEDDWEYARDVDALHRKIFVGNTLGMPHWGLRRMRPRDIVAVEKYIREVLRAEAG